MVTQNNIGNVKWKKAHKKQYDIYVSMPPKGTVVVNKLEQFDTVKFFNGKTWFSVDEIQKLSAENQTTIKNIVQQGKAYLVDDAHPFVLAGTVGEFWTVKPDTLAKKYGFVVDNNVVDINKDSLQKKMKNGILDWTLVRSNIDTSEVFACFMPVEKKGQVKSSYAVLNYNDASVQHGKGDFIIARYTNPDGTPNTSNLSVVNGLVFRDTYDNRGWSDCLDSSATKNAVDVSKLPKITSIKNTSYGNILRKNLPK